MDLTIQSARKVAAKVDGLFSAQGDDFETVAVNALEVCFEGIPGDFHAGLTRRSGSREPWYPRGTEMRNERQLTILSRAELGEAASQMGIDSIEPEWIGGNLTLAGIPMLSMLPAGTLMFFAGGATLKVDFQNAPCRLSGKTIARNVGREGDVALALSFVSSAKRRRGLTAWVEKPGRIELGETVELRLPEQWIYPPE